MNAGSSIGAVSSLGGIGAILRRELNAYFFSPLAYVVATVFLAINGFFFSYMVQALNDPRQTQGAAMEMFFGSNWWLAMLLVVPALTMRLIAEERKSGTIEMLLTAPLTEAQVVLGKFLGAFVFFVFLWVPTLFYVWIVASYSAVEPGPILAGYFGVLLLGAYLLAVGVFASSLTKNQLVSAIVCFAMLIILIVLSAIAFVVEQPALKNALGYIDLFAHMQDFARGIVDSRRLVYYLSGTAFFLWMATLALEAKKGS